MRTLLNTIIVCFLLISCHQKYEMTNMVPEEVDVTEFILSGEFQPDSCEGRLDRLIKTRPTEITESYENELQSKLKQWQRKYNGWLINYNEDTVDLKVIQLHQKAKYQYSYIAFNDIINVYRIDTDLNVRNNRYFKLFFQLDQSGKLVSDFNESGWILNKCDSINSVVQNLYTRTE